ncbi:hypothetical protein [Litorimonas haliclonae]|uniref:hypothetical protein n=1 Tax=Litorimonas haliclonae TaxID=2081977 RepID=UPI0039F02B1C
MLWKSLLTGTLLAGLAGAVVYFGTGGEIATAGVKADFQQAVSNTKEATKSVADDVSESASDTIEKMASASDSLEAKVKESLSDEEKAEPPKSHNSKAEDTNKSEKKWLDRYLKKKDNADNSDKNRTEQAPVNVDDMDASDVDGAVRNILKKERETPIEQETSEGQETESDDDIQRTESPDSAAQKTAMSLDMNSSEEVRAVYGTALAEAKDISIVELRDRAYLSLIDYTIRKKDFKRSKAVITEISQPELRDTARSNIAVGLARLGKRDAAFATLEDVETQALADVLRLQVIEAMTAPSQNQANSAIPTN